VTKTDLNGISNGFEWRVELWLFWLVSMET